MGHDIWPNLIFGFRNIFRISGRMGRTPFWFWVGILHLSGGLGFSLWLLGNDGNVGGALDSIWLDPLRAFEGIPAVTTYLGYLRVTWPTMANALPQPILDPHFSGWLRPFFLILFIASIGALIRRIRDTGLPFKASLILCFWPLLSPLLFAFVFPFAMEWMLRPMSDSDWALIQFGLPVAAKYLSLIASVLAFFILTAPSVTSPNPSEASP
jgi:uncharacterized membrane protein YhaH (DUF805 family)